MLMHISLTNRQIYAGQVREYRQTKSKVGKRWISVLVDLYYTDC